jgi:hypothetical protein
MFQTEDTKHLNDFHIKSYQDIMDDLSSQLERVSTRLYDSTHVEELYRFGDTQYFLEVFYPVPSAWQIRDNASFALNDAQVQFGIFNWETNQPIPLEKAFYELPKKYRTLICFNVDHFSEMEDVFDKPQNL